jgi:hypothetical protein
VKVVRDNDVVVIGRLKANTPPRAIPQDDREWGFVWRPWTPEMVPGIEKWWS